MIYEKNDVIREQIYQELLVKKKIHHFLNWLENVS